MNDVRFIATTNKDLQAEVERGTFRRDLFYRLSVMPVRVPALRERPEDVPLLARFFLKQAARRSKKTVRDIAAESLRPLARPSEHLLRDVDGRQFGVLGIETQVASGPDADLQNAPARGADHALAPRLAAHPVHRCLTAVIELCDPVVDSGHG